MDGFPPDFRAVVQRERHRTVGYVWASREPCTVAATFESEAVPGRSFRRVRSLDLALLPDQPRWTMGFFVCADDDLEDPVAWAAAVPQRERRRILFLAGPAVHKERAEEKLARTAPGVVVLFTTALAKAASAPQAHRLYGRHHARQAYDDRSEAP